MLSSHRGIYGENPARAVVTPAGYMQVFITGTVTSKRVTLSDIAGHSAAYPLPPALAPQAELMNVGIFAVHGSPIELGIGVVCVRGGIEGGLNWGGGGLHLVPPDTTRRGALWRPGTMFSRAVRPCLGLDQNVYSPEDEFLRSAGGAMASEPIGTPVKWARRCRGEMVLPADRQTGTGHGLFH